jgi:hypothetical protein
MGRNGDSWTQIAAELGIAKSTLYLWKDQYPEFSDALSSSRTFSQAWWETIGKGQMISPLQGFSAGLWGKQMSCRFPDDYTDKSKTDITTGGEKLSLDINLVRK